MAIRTYKVTLDTKNAIAPEPVFLRQGDKTGAVVIDATLMDNGSPVSLSGLTPMFKANTADGQAVIADSTGFTVTDSANGEFTYQVPNALSSVPGKITTAYFSFSDSSGSESTFDVAFIINKAVDITQAQADDYITIIDGTLNSLQKKIDDMNTDIKTVLNAYNQGDFYNKSQTDSKDAATLASAKAYADAQDATVMTSVTTEMDKKVDKGGVGQVTWGMASQDFRQQITGGSAAVVGKDSVITENIVDKAVTAAKTNFVDADVNIANPANISNGYRYDISNGIVSKISDSERNCILIPVASDYWYSMNIDTYSTNFSHAVDSNMKQVSLFLNLEKDSASIFKTTSTTRFIAITVASTVDLTKLVVMQKRENILNYTTKEWPYNHPGNIKIPGLQVGGSPVEELKNPSYKDVVSKKSEILKASEFIVFSGGTNTDNTWSGSGQYQGIYTRFFESNFEETMIDIDVTVSGLTSVDVMLRYRDSTNASKYITLFESTSSFKTTLSFDASNLAIYNDAKDFAILVRNTGTSEGSFTIDNLLVYTDEMRKTSFYADNLKNVLLNIDEQLKDIKPTEETILTSTSGKKFKLMISDDGNLTVKALAFSKINISGNSLVNGINQGSHGTKNFGMCASDSKHDFNYLVQQAILAKNTDATFTQTQISGIEMATNQAEYEAYRDSIANSYTADTDLIILQIGDNTTQYIETFENTFPQFLAWLKGKCPIADIVVVGTWFSKAVGYPVVKQCALDAGLTFVDISALNTNENQASSGAIITYDDGTTVTASESWIRHPGNVGMQKIADKIIESVGV